MKKILFINVIFLALLACKKDKFLTKPQISIKSYNDKILTQGNDLIVTLNYTDKEGDLANGQLVYFPKRLNLLPPSDPNAVIADSIKTPLAADFPDTDKGEIAVRFPQSYYQKSDVADTFIFKLVLVDRMGNKSDTLTTDKVIFVK
jgi:hypothetical protein